jgi:hypothetical protein
MNPISIKAIKSTFKPHQTHAFSDIWFHLGEALRFYYFLLKTCRQNRLHRDRVSPSDSEVSSKFFINFQSFPLFALFCV